MRSRNNIIRMVVLTLAFVATALPAVAGGPLLIFDAGSQTPYAYGGPVPMITDLGALGAVPNASADALVAGSAAQWAGVPSSSFNAAVTGDFAGVGLPDITGANAGLVIGTDNPGDGIFVIYDTDGTVTQNFLGAPPGVLGVASPEFAAGAVLTESWVVLNGSTINPGDLPGATSWQGVITHEMGHSINMAHTQTNGAVIFFGDDTGASGCLPPYGGGPGFNAMETMFPFIDPSPGSTGVQQATIEHPDDTTTLSDLYPAGGYPGGFATIEGTVFNTNGISPVTGVNVIARNIANPFLDAVSALSGDFTQGGLGPDGRYRLTGLTPGANYVLYVDEIIQGGFSTPPLQPLGAPEEYWNASEANNDIADPPCDFTAINVAAGQTVTADFQLNGAAPSPAIGVSPSGFSFSIPTNTMASDIMNISNIAGPGAGPLNWTIVDATSASDLPVNAMALDPARISIDRSGLDSRDPAAMRQCRDCAGEHAARVTPLAFDSAAMAPGVISDGSFELGPGSGAWAEASTNFGTPICDAGLCGTGGGTGPRTGIYWTWFGGIAAFEAGSVSQNVVLPSGGPLALEFYLELNTCDSPADYMEVRIDGNQVFAINGGDATCGSIGYTLYSVDISAFADDASHIIQFRSEIFATGGGGSNFFLDDVSLVQATSDCPWLSAAPTAGSTPQGGSSPVSVMVDATGLAPGLYLCELRIASNDPGNPLIAVPVDLEVLPAGPTEINAIVFPVNPLSGPVSLFSLPDGTGEPLAAAQLWNGVPGDSPIIVDATIGVRLVDQAGNPIVGFPPEPIRVQSQFGGWKECTTSFLIADGPTDTAGLTTISGRLFAGGFSGPGELMQVVVDDPLFQAATYPGGEEGLEYFVNSADITGDLQANLSDVAAFAGPYINGPFAYAIDFRRDGVANLSDVSRLGIGVGALCPAPPVAAMAEAPSLRVTETIGVAFDVAGTIQARMLEPGKRIDAYVFLQGPATEQGIEAFDTRVRVSDNVVIHEREVVGRGLNVAGEDDFTVGLAEARRADASRVAPVVRLRVSVKDDSPAYFWVEPTSRSGEAVPTVSIEGRIRGARPVSGDVDLAVASLNDKDFALDGGATPRARLAMGIAPNPFNPMTQIRFELPASGPVDLRVFDARGQLVTVLRTEDMAAGRHEVVWNGTDRTGRVVATGVYFARLQTREGTLLEKMMLMK